MQTSRLETASGGAIGDPPTFRVGVLPKKIIQPYVAFTFDV